MRSRHSAILRGGPCSSGSARGRGRSATWPAGSPCRAPRSRNTSACSSRPGSCASAARARATTTASTETAWPSSAPTSKGSGTRRLRPSRPRQRAKEEMRMNQKTDELAVRRSVFVRCTPEHAFHVYTERMDDWYPLEGHSLFDDPNGTVHWERHVGGRVYERSPGGEEGAWGTIVAWDPPNGFTMTWHPGRGEETAQAL